MKNYQNLHNGDEKAMGEMVRAELPKIYNLCLKLCRNPQDAQDLCQDSFVRAIRSIDKFRGDSQLSTWLYRITVNTWKNRVRSEKRRHFSMHVSISGNHHSSEEDENRSELQLVEKDPTPAESFETKEIHREVIRALNDLDPEDKTIIVLKDVEDRTYEEISQILDLNIGTVKSQLSRARNRLREAHKKITGRVS